MINSERNNAPDTPESPLVSERPMASATRRRFMKAGVAPVILTLAIRPGLAWHCNAPSAWGSAKQAGFVGSVMARNTSHEIGDETWTLSEWKNNTFHAGIGNPWVKLGTQTTTNGVTSGSKNYTVGTLFSGLTIPSGLLATDKVWTKLSGTNPNGTPGTAGTAFQQCMIVARLNFKLLSTVRSCLNSSTGADQLNLMASGSYAPANGGTPWGQAQIIEYLANNYIAVMT